MEKQKLATKIHEARRGARGSGGSGGTCGASSFYRLRSLGMEFSTILSPLEKAVDVPNGRSKFTMHQKANTELHILEKKP